MRETLHGYIFLTLKVYCVRIANSSFGIIFDIFGCKTKLVKSENKSK